MGLPTDPPTHWLWRRNQMALSRIRTEADLLLFLHDDAAIDRQSVVTWSTG